MALCVNAKALPCTTIVCLQLESVWWFLQFGRGQLTPNNPNSVPTIVKYGYTATNLNFTETGYAEVIAAPPSHGILLVSCLLEPVQFHAFTATTRAVI